VIVLDISDVVEEYLEAIYRLQEKGGAAKTSELVYSLKVAPGTVTNTIERLERENLVTHELYRGVKLTDKGRKIALNIVRKHRLSERLLTDLLGFEWERVHDAACRLEHGISDEVAKKMEEALGRPRTCPHGNPIPTERGEVLEEELHPLAELNPTDRGVVSKITDEGGELLQYLSSLGLKPGAGLEVVDKAPFNGPLTVIVNGSRHALGREAAATVMVRKAST
jgi:DtxR family Mn-dependent transcriptional regulator